MMIDKQQKNQSEAAWWQPGLVIFIQVSSWIAGPIIIALFLGRWLDNKYQTEPWLFLACMALAFGISSVGIVKITLAYIKKIENEAQNNKLNERK